MRCKYRKKGEKQCQAHTMMRSEYCFFHSPDSKDVKSRELAQSKGGKGNLIKVDNPLPPIKIDGVGDVVLLLEDTINRVRAGELDVKIGNCIGVLSGQLIKAIEVSNVVNRVEIIERAIFEKRTRS